MPTIASAAVAPFRVEVIDMEVENSDFHSELPVGTFTLDFVLHVTELDDDTAYREADIDVVAEVDVVDGQAIGVRVSRVGPPYGAAVPAVPGWIGNGQHPQILAAVAKAGEDQWEAAGDQWVSYEESKWDRGGCQR